MTAALAILPASAAPVTVSRTVNAALLNRVANDPAVRPWLSCEEMGVPADAPIDLSEAIRDLSNVALVTNGGGFLLHARGGGDYEVHSMFLPEARSGTVAAMRAGMDYMFTRTDCQKLITKVPDDNKAAANLAAAGGFKPVFRREAVWNGGGVSYQALTIDDWAMANAGLEADGEWFHRKLEEAKKAAGSELPIHGHDEAHERAVGAAVRMIRAGNVAKGVAFYNRWARLAGCPEIGLLSMTPVVLDVVDAVIELRDGDMEILTCR